QRRQAVVDRGVDQGAGERHQQQTAAGNSGGESRGAGLVQGGNRVADPRDLRGFGDRNGAAEHGRGFQESAGGGAAPLQSAGYGRAHRFRHGQHRVPAVPVRLRGFREQLPQVPGVALGVLGQSPRGGRRQVQAGADQRETAHVIGGE